MNVRNSFCLLHGDGFLSAGEPCRIYRAARKIICAGCRLQIGVGELFTISEADHEPELMTCRCISCAPFRLIVNSVKQSSQPEKLSVRQLTPEEIDRSIEERLGPALKRRRRGLLPR